jgi:hypothetical protein
MAKASGKSKTDVTARAALKAQQALCRICGKKPDHVRVLTPTGKTYMMRKLDGKPCEICNIVR